MKLPEVPTVNIPKIGSLPDVPTGTNPQFFEPFTMDKNTRARTRIVIQHQWRHTYFTLAENSEVLLHALNGGSGAIWWTRLKLKGCSPK